MSEATAERTSRRGQRNAPEPTPDAEPTPDGQPTPDAETPPDLARLATLNPDAEDLTDEDRAAFAALTDKQRDEIAELREVAAIEGFTAEVPEDVKRAGQPIRNRKPPQVAMDRVVQKAYAAWVTAERPSTWSRMPTITYFLTPEELPEWRKLIRNGATVAVPESYEKDGKPVEPTGVRVRFGNEFVLTPKMAEKIGKPDEAGKTVLQWAAIDKRHSGKNGNTDSDN